VRLRTICRDRWALVKALVLGASKVSEFPEHFRMVPAVSEMLVQRNAVFAALAEIRPSALWLAAYVEHLIEQIGVLP
jgi:hypothetical protein